MRLTILGAYRPALDPERLQLFADDHASGFIEGVRRLQRQGAARQWQWPALIARAAEIRQELLLDLGRAVLFEMRVERAAGECFDPASLHQLGRAGILDSGYAAWEPSFLSADGERTQQVDECPLFRVAFYIHEWPNGSELVGPTGALRLPPFVPVPERLWRLAPYALLD